MDLSEATWPDVADADTDLAVLPVGSTEQHGPHAPLGTDTITAAAVADAGTDAYDGAVVVAPTIPVGVSAEHRQFTGTLWLSPDTFRSVIRDVVTSLASHGLTRVVVVNGHGGNTPALGEVCAALTREGTAFTVPFTWFDSVDADVGHAGRVETSVLQAVAPDTVRDDRREPGADAWGEWVAGVNLAVDTIEFTETGVVGDPTQADAATGEALLDTAAAALATLLGAVAARDWSPGPD
ncbi:MAG: creatininase family protein [Halobacteriaceae archaeon]